MKYKLNYGPNYGPDQVLRTSSENCSKCVFHHDNANSIKMCQQGTTYDLKRCTSYGNNSYYTRGISLNKDIKVL
jgi:hypothetical protein